LRISDFEMFDDFYGFYEFYVFEDLTKSPCTSSLAPYAGINNK